MSRLGILSVAALALVGGCSDGSDGAAPEPSDAPTAATTTSEPTDAATATETDGAGVDCDAVEQAQQDLSDATNAELERLGIARSDPRAFSVQVLVTSKEAAEYWTSLRDAVDPAEAELRGDADTVVAYWETLDADLDGIEIPDGDEATLAAATEQYLEVSSAYPDDEVVPAQERLTAGIDGACGATTDP